VAEHRADSELQSPATAEPNSADGPATDCAGNISAVRQHRSLILELAEHAISFYESGKSQKGRPVAEKSLDWCVERLGMRASGRIPDLKTKLTIGEKEDSIQALFGGFRFAVVRVDENDLQGKNDWKTGLTTYLRKTLRRSQRFLTGHSLELRKDLVELMGVEPTASRVRFQSWQGSRLHLTTIPKHFNI
jgi:hypothetical protein